MLSFLVLVMLFYLAVGTVVFVLWSWYGDISDGGGIPAIVVGLLWPLTVIGLLGLGAWKVQQAIRQVRDRRREVPSPELATYRSDNHERCSTCGGVI